MPRASVESAARKLAGAKAQRALATLPEHRLRGEHEQAAAENEQLREALATIELTLQRYADHYDLAPVGYLTIDRSGFVREANQAACAIFQLERPRVLGALLRTMVPLPDRPAVAQHLGLCRRRGLATTRLHLLRKDGSTLEVDLTSRRAAGERQSYYPTTIVELADSEKERESLLAAAREAIDSSLAKTEFLAMVSHELRAPLTPLLAAVAALEQRPTGDPELENLFQIIRRSITTEARLIDDLLDTTRLRRGKMLLHRSPSDLHEVVCSAVEQLRPAIATKKLRVREALAAELHLVNGDPIRLGQVFTNLIGNAVKFTPPGGDIWLRSWVSGETIAVEVSDSGPGIAPAALPRLFAAFEQVDRPAGSEGGLGLGLVISKGLVELHQGKISAGSAGPGKGARFVVELPLLRGAATAPSTTNGHGVKKSPARILLVEDNRDTAEALALALGMNGYRVDHAPSLRAALGADLGGIDVVVSDLRLPDGDGRSLLKALRARGPVTAIALSGYGAEEDRETTRAAGFFAHLVKPVEVSLLAETIEQALAERRRGT